MGGPLTVLEDDSYYNRDAYKKQIPCYKRGTYWKGT